MKVWISGSSGFIGKHVVRRLKKSKINFIPVSLRSNGQGILLSELLAKPNLIEKNDVLLHLAAAGVSSQQDESENLIMEVNFKMSFALVEIFLRKPNTRIVSLGTGLENFLNKLEELNNDSQSLRTISYVKSKTAFTNEIAKLNSTRILHLKPYYVFGEGSNKNRLDWNIRNSFLEGSPIALRNPERVMDFINVCDLSKFVARSFINLESYGIHELSTGQGTKNRNFVEKSIASLGRKTPKLQFSYVADDRQLFSYTGIESSISNNCIRKISQFTSIQLWNSLWKCDCI